MYLFRSWKESLEVFKPSVLSQLLPVVKTNIKRAYKTLWDMQFYLFVAGLAVFFVDLFICRYLPFQTPLIWQVIRFVFWTHWCLSAVLALRASVMPKDREYFAAHRLHEILLLVFYGILFYARYQFFMAGFVYQSLLFLGDFHWKLVFILPWIVLLIEMIGLLWCALTAFFLFDARPLLGSLICSIGRALLMLFYNKPFFVILIILALIPYIFYLIPDMFLPLSMPYALLVKDLLLMIVPVLLALLNAFYIKRVHEQFSCYFWQQAK